MQDYTTITGVLRLREEKVSYRDIAAKFGIGEGMVVRVLEKAKSLGIDYDKIKDMDPDEVTEKFYNMSLPRSTKPQPDFDVMYRQLHDCHSKCNLYYLWCEYKKEYLKGMQYTQFCAQYHAWEKTSRQKAVMVINRIPGEKLYIDWIGDTLQLKLC